MQEIDGLLNFWFEYDQNPQALFDRSIWWMKNDGFDAQIKEKYEGLRTQAVNGQLNDWLKTPKGTLAYIILIDQFSRNLYRNTPQMFEHDPLALTAAKDAIDKGFDHKLSLTEKVFMYLPFEHSENLDDQKMSMKLYGQLLLDTPEENKDIAEKYMFYVKEHYDIIERFGRFPHRNKILNRESTPEELEFLEGHQGF